MGKKMYISFMERSEAIEKMRMMCRCMGIDTVTQADRPEMTVFDRVMLVRDDGRLEKRGDRCGEETEEREGTIYGRAVVYSGGFVFCLPRVVAWNFAAETLEQLSCKLRNY